MSLDKLIWNPEDVFPPGYPEFPRYCGECLWWLTKCSCGEAHCVFAGKDTPPCMLEERSGCSV